MCEQNVRVKSPVRVTGSGEEGTTGKLLKMTPASNLE